MSEDFSKIANEVASELNVVFSEEKISEVLSYCKHKLTCINKDESYLPILFKIELLQSVQIAAINNLSKQYMEFEKRGIANA